MSDRVSRLAELRRNRAKTTEDENNNDQLRSEPQESVNNSSDQVITKTDSTSAEPSKIYQKLTPMEEMKSDLQPYLNKASIKTNRAINKIIQDKLDS
ncbi:uncharacterized protein KGF55_000517 [Candida pseudojiufengensis]|uniref:uncharacterized protein n=1 Tax=Candida pseudojiufengensis TaxID=497109 RepID=UPI002225953B|nr:uncharacterized protein KGF55_000517 [Candida pseudojiufengensis]KAI5966208.1 hypothetical protein KGF55_000517 [Candida pseudojiufengensis]